MKRFLKMFSAVFMAFMLVFTTFAAACAGPLATPPSGSVSESVTPADYTVTYRTGFSDVSVPSLTAQAGSDISAPEDPETDGYVFKYWQLDGKEFIFDKMPECDITLTAVWEKLYTISFDTGEGATRLAPIAFEKGEKIVLPEAPLKNGYKFTGWTSDGEPFADSIMPAHDLTLVATWRVYHTYTIRFITGATDCTVPSIVEEAGVKISAPEIDRPEYYLKNWLLDGKEYTFDTMPAENITLIAQWVKLTNLPAMFIELSDKSGNTYPLSEVDRENYVNSRITLTNTAAEYKLTDLKSGFKGRGNGSWSAGDKKGYKLKFDKKQSVFGRAANKHWVLLACINFDDPTMCRNYLAYNMANELFDYIEYATCAEWIDLYVNGEYRGVYLLCEHVRVADGRVDIPSEYGVNDTGFLVEYDAYAEGREGIDYFRVGGLKYPFTVHSPSPEDFATDGKISESVYRSQIAFIKNYVTTVYQAALRRDFTTFAQYADTDSFVDMYILHELFKNVDTGYSSFYLYKKPSGKLFAGPPWDFDATTNINERGDRTPRGLYVAKQVLEGSDFCASELYINLYKTAGFKTAVIVRWQELSPRIADFIEERMNDVVYATYREAMGKNFALWKRRTQITAENYWVNDMKTLKKWLLDRVAWLDTEWK